MRTELVEKLKQAGFPQKEVLDSGSYSITKVTSNGEEYFYVPNINELAEEWLLLKTKEVNI